MASFNVFGEPIITCSTKPLTGYFRNGCCDTDESDFGMHTVCAIMTDDFLEFSKQMGNDLSTPRLEYGFEGLKEGDKWCLCAPRWVEAYNAGKAPLVYLEATNENMLELVKLEVLVKFAFKGNPVV
jgi:uncharacterized protein (DUF2237 family)